MFLHMFILLSKERAFGNIEMRVKRVKPYERMWKVIVIALIVKVHEPVWIVHCNEEKNQTAVRRSTWYGIHNIKSFQVPKIYRMFVFSKKAMPTRRIVYIGQKFNCIMKNLHKMEINMYDDHLIIPMILRWIKRYCQMESAGSVVTLKNSVDFSMEFQFAHPFRHFLSFSSELIDRIGLSLIWFHLLQMLYVFNQLTRLDSTRTRVKWQFPFIRACEQSKEMEKTIPPIKFRAMQLKWNEIEIEIGINY